MGWIGIFSVITIGFIIGFIFLKKKYKEELKQVAKEEYSLKCFLPLGLFIIDKSFIGSLYKNINVHILELYGKQEYPFRVRLYEGERITIGAIIFFLSVLLVLGLSIKSFKVNNLYELERPEFGKGNQSYQAYYNLNGERGERYEAMTILVAEKWPSVSQRGKELERLLEELPKVILKNNISFEYVDQPLGLIENIKDGIQITWKSQNEKLILNNGEIRTNNIKKEGEEVIIRAYINCYGEEVEENYKVNVYKRILSDGEIKKNLKKDMKDALKVSSRLGRNTMKLPLSISGYDINLSWYDGEKRSGYLLYLLCGGVIGFGFYIAKGYELNEKIKKRQEELLLAFPGLINKLTLLMNAGMPLCRAWGKIVKDYCTIKERGGKSILLYEEMKLTQEDIQKGVSEIKAYEAFGQRCKIPEVLRFTAMIIQNIKKGSHLIIGNLEQQSKEAMKMREDLARKKGEKASTRLVFPMGIMFIAILIIVIVPAVLSLKGGI